MGFESSQNIYVKDNSPVESSSRNAYTTSRTENHTNHSFKGKRDMTTNSRDAVYSNRMMNEASGSSQHVMYKSNPIMDSGYGSLDKLKTNGNGMRSPVLTRRTSDKMAKQKFSGTPTGNSFDSDDDGSDERGSSGFVNTIGAPLTMKDTAYDYVRIKK